MSAPLGIGLDPARRDAAAASRKAREYLNFRLGHEEYGVDILCVQEIRNHEQPTRIAGAGGFLQGVLDLRGVIVPVVDLRPAFGVEPRFDALTVTVILQIAGRTVGAVVDAVSDVLELAPGQIRPMPELQGSARDLHVTGLASIPGGDTDRLILLLDIAALLMEPSMGLLHDEAAAVEQAREPSPASKSTPSPELPALAQAPSSVIEEVK